MKKNYKQSFKTLVVLLVAAGMLLMPLAAFAEGDGVGGEGSAQATPDNSSGGSSGGGASDSTEEGNSGTESKETGSGETDGDEATSGSTGTESGKSSGGETGGSTSNEGDNESDLEQDESGPDNEDPVNEEPGNETTGNEGGKTGEDAGSESSNTEGSGNKGTGGAGSDDNEADKTKNDAYTNQSAAANPEIVEEDEKFDGNTYSAVVEYENLTNSGDPLFLGDLGLFTITFTEIGKSRIGSAKITLPEGFTFGLDPDVWSVSFKSEDPNDVFDSFEWDGKIDRDEGILSLWATAREYYLEFGQSLIATFEAYAPGEISDSAKWDDEDGKDDRIGIYEFITEAWTNATDKDDNPLYEDGSKNSSAGEGIGTPDRKNTWSENYSQLKVWVGNNDFKTQYKDYQKWLENYGGDNLNHEKAEKAWKEAKNKWDAWSNWLSSNSVDGYAVFEGETDEEPPDSSSYNVSLKRVDKTSDPTQVTFQFEVDFTKNNNGTQNMKKLEIDLPAGFTHVSYSDNVELVNNTLVWKGDYSGGTFEIALTAQVKDGARQDFYSRAYYEAGNSGNEKRLRNEKFNPSPRPEQPDEPGEKPEKPAYPQFEAPDLPGGKIEDAGFKEDIPDEGDEGENPENPGDGPGEGEGEESGSGSTGDGGDTGSGEETGEGDEGSGGDDPTGGEGDEGPGPVIPEIMPEPPFLPLITPPVPPAPTEEGPAALLVATPGAPLGEGPVAELVVEPEAPQTALQETEVLPEGALTEPVAESKKVAWWPLLLLLIPGLIWFLLARLVLVRVPGEDGEYETVARKLARRKEKRWYVDVEEQLEEYLVKHGEVMVDFRGGLIKEADKAVYAKDAVLGAGEVRYALIGRSRFVTWVEDLDQESAQVVS